jgi:RNA polymerase sigma-70 factor (ECF subfamily)
VEATVELIEHARTSRAAFAELYALYIDRVFRFFLAYTGSVPQAEDLAEETFARVLAVFTRPAGEKAGYEERGVPFSSWLLRVGANIMHDAWRTNRTSLLSLDLVPADDEAYGPLGDRIADPRQVDPASLVDAWERVERLRASLALLHPDYRRVLHLRYWEEHGWAEVATRMGRTESAVKKLGNRALRMLAVLVREEELRTNLGHLPDDQQCAVRARFLEGQDVATVARRMGRSEGSVEWLLEGALKTLWEEGIRTDV